MEIAMNGNLSLAYAQSLDQQDKLALFRDRFVIDDPDLIYLDGNSLGRLPKQTIDQTRRLVETEWGQQLIRGWNSGWLAMQSDVGAKLARLLGASEGEVIVADSTSVNLYKLALAAMQAQPGRNKIVTDDLNFPSDIYILQGIGQTLGRSCEIVVVPTEDERYGPVEKLAAAIDTDTALVTLTHTTFKSSYTYPMTEITTLAQKAGALMLWDLSHSAGSVPINLAESQADLAVGCTYKYLNGGPGAPAFLYVRHDLQDRLANPISGWMGQRNTFDFDLNYAPEMGIRRFLSGTPPILSLSTIEAGVDLLLEAGMDHLRAKSVAQSEYLIRLWEALLAPLGFTLNSPPEPALRGSHIALGHPDGWRIAQALIQEMKVLPDFRKPDNIRFGIAPIYNSFSDIYLAMTRLQTVVTEQRYTNYDNQLTTVT